MVTERDNNLGSTGLLLKGDTTGPCLVGEVLPREREDRDGLDTGVDEWVEIERDLSPD